MYINICYKSDQTEDNTEDVSIVDSNIKYKEIKISNDTNVNGITVEELVLK